MIYHNVYKNSFNKYKTTITNYSKNYKYVTKILQILENKGFAETPKKIMQKLQKK